MVETCYVEVETLYAMYIRNNTMKHTSNKKLVTCLGWKLTYTLPLMDIDASVIASCTSIRYIYVFDLYKRTKIDSHVVMWIVSGV